MTTTTITRDDEATDVRRRLLAHEQTLTAARAEHDQADAAVADALLARSLGRKVESRNLQALIDERDRLAAIVEEEGVVVAGLGERVRTWDLAERQRQHERDQARLEELSRRAPRLEAAYADLASQLVAAGHELLSVQREYDDLDGAVRRYRHANGLPGVGTRRPAAPFEIPSQYLRFTTWHVGWDQWLREWRADHR